KSHANSHANSATSHASTPANSRAKTHAKTHANSHAKSRAKSHALSHATSHANSHAKSHHRPIQWQTRRYRENGGRQRHYWKVQEQHLLRSHEPPVLAGRTLPPNQLRQGLRRI